MKKLLLFAIGLAMCVQSVRATEMSLVYDVSSRSYLQLTPVGPSKTAHDVLQIKGFDLSAGLFAGWNSTDGRSLISTAVWYSHPLAKEIDGRLGFAFRLQDSKKAAFAPYVGFSLHF